MMHAYLSELVASRELLWRWTQREFGVRYRQSLLGVAWAVLQPLAPVIVFSIVFSVFVQLPTQGMPYPVFAYSTLLPWTFFANALGFAIPSLVNNFNLVSRIRFPREILPLSAIAVCLIDALIASLGLVLLLVYYRIPAQVGWLLLPLLLIVQLMLTIGIGLAAAALNVFFRDIRFVVPLALQLLMYACPVVYPASLVPEWLRPLYFLNPLATLMDGYRTLLFEGRIASWPLLLLATAISTSLMVFSYAYFKWAEIRFADLI
jgi:lipopolysaccharide transport system permease protein